MLNRPAQAWIAQTATLSLRCIITHYAPEHRLPGECSLNPQKRTAKLKETATRGGHIAWITEDTSLLRYIANEEADGNGYGAITRRSDPLGRSLE